MSEDLDILDILNYDEKKQIILMFNALVSKLSKSVSGVVLANILMIEYLKRKEEITTLDLYKKLILKCLFDFKNSNRVDTTKGEDFENIEINI